MIDTMARHWRMLQHIPKYPAKTDTAALLEKLAAEGFLVNPRTIERDLIKLSQYFDIEADKRERPYGWSWSPFVKGLNLPGMTISQAVTFALAKAHLKPLLPVSMLDQLAPFFQRAQTALNNLNEVVASKWPEKVRVIHATQSLLPPHIDETVQEAVYSALFTDCQLRIGYIKKGAQEPKDYIVNPLGLVQRGQIMYLICTYPSSNKPMSLAIHRIHSAEQLANRSDVRDNFSLDKLIEEGLLAFPRSELTEFMAIFDRKAASHLYESPLSQDQIIYEVDDTHVCVQATIADTEQLKWWILGFGLKVEVIKPLILRNRITDIVKGLHRTYCETAVN